MSGSNSKYVKQRTQMVKELQERGYIHSEKLAKAMRTVPRENFMAKKFKKHSYNKYSPFPIPPFDSNHTISAPNTYPLFYEPIDLQEGDKCLEVGMGSGYGAALLKEIVGDQGTVITIETNPKTYEFGKKNLKNAGYDNITIIHGDGTKGYPPKAPYDKIIVTASYVEVPKPLVNQLAAPGKLVMPLGHRRQQFLTLLTKNENGKIEKQRLERVLYVPLKGDHGYKK